MRQDLLDLCFNPISFWSNEVRQWDDTIHGADEPFSNSRRFTPASVLKWFKFQPYPVTIIGLRSQYQIANAWSANRVLANRKGIFPNTWLVPWILRLRLDGTGLGKLVLSLFTAAERFKQMARRFSSPEYWLWTLCYVTQPLNASANVRLHNIWWV